MLFVQSAMKKWSKGYIWYISFHPFAMYSYMAATDSNNEAVIYMASITHTCIVLSHVQFPAKSPKGINWGVQYTPYPLDH